MNPIHSQAPKNPAEMEAALLQEFNLHKEAIPNPASSGTEYVQSRSANVSSNNLATISKSNNMSGINANDIQKVKDTLNNTLNQQIQEGEFLNYILESDKQLLNSLLDEVEKISRQSNKIAEENKFYKDQILEYRRKINMEKDNLIKVTSKLYNQTNELMNAKGKHFL